MGLLGPNGAGKTSVIKMLLGLVRPDAGEVLLLGRPAPRPAGAGPRRLPAGAVPVPAVAHRRRGARPARTARRRRRVRRRAARVPGRWSASPTARATGWAASPRACSSASGWPSRWSPGPSWSSSTSRPAPSTRSAGPTSATCCSSLKERGVAVLLNSHLIGEVERVCDRVVILDHGQVAASGTLAELLGRRELRLRLDGVGADGERPGWPRPAGSRASGDTFTVELAADSRGHRRAGPGGRPGRARRARARGRARAGSASRNGCSASCAPTHGGDAAMTVRTVLTVAAPHRCGRRPAGGCCARSPA